MVTSPPSRPSRFTRLVTYLPIQYRPSSKAPPVDELFETPYQVGFLANPRRVEESAGWFARPFFGRGGYDAHLARNPLQTLISTIQKRPPRTMRADHAESIFAGIQPRIDAHFAATNDIQASVAELFPLRSTAEMNKAIAHTQRLLENFPVERTAGSGVVSSLSEKMDHLGLTSAQLERVVECLAEYRLSLDQNRPFDRESSDTNWRHILGEMSYVIDALHRRHITGRKAEDALLVSLFTDCAKFGPTLLTHNIDGAAAALHILRRRGDADMSAERLAAIVTATKEHQIGPPSFMAKIVGVALGLYAPDLSEDRRALIESIQEKIADPFNPRHIVIEPSGAARIAWTDEQQSALAAAGIMEWAVPHPNNPWFDISMVVIAGDSMVNYATPEGVGKIIRVSGPGTAEALQDPTIYHSMFNCGMSLLDSSRLLPPDWRELLTKLAHHTKQHLQSVSLSLKNLLATGEPLPIRIIDLIPDPHQITDQDEALTQLSNLTGVDRNAITAHRGFQGDRILIDLPPSPPERPVPFVDVPLDYRSRQPEAEADQVRARLIRYFVASELHHWLERGNSKPRRK